METSLLRHLKTNMIGLTQILGILLSVENLPQASAYRIHGCHHFVDFDSLFKLPKYLLTYIVNDNHSMINTNFQKQNVNFHLLVYGKINSFRSFSRKIELIILKTFSSSIWNMSEH